MRAQDEFELSESHIAQELSAGERKTLSTEQYRAVEMCCDLTELIVGVTGGAGTGKTLVIGRIHELLVEDKKRVALCAPTGRAAKRIQELTGIPARTVHRLLEFPMPGDGDDAPPNLPRRDRMNPLLHDVVIVDEASMVDSVLYRQLIDALPKKGVIRFFGDNNQLPPVEDGSGMSSFLRVLKERPMVELTYNFRNEDRILDNAQRILRGSVPVRNSQFEIIYSDDPIRQMLRFVEHEPCFKQDDHQIIMPTRRGNCGTLIVNPSLQLSFNPHGRTLELARYERGPKLAVRAGDKFLWIKNDYQLNMYNGEIGRIAWVDPEDGELGLETTDRQIHVPARVRQYSPYLQTTITYDPRKQIELGYAVTTHKAQGSEFDAVVYCMAGKQGWLLNRRNFYTGVTRAKKLVVVITDRKAMSMSMRRYQG